MGTPSTSVVVALAKPGAAARFSNIYIYWVLTKKVAKKIRLYVAQEGLACCLPLSPFSKLPAAAALAARRRAPPEGEWRLHGPGVLEHVWLSQRELASAGRRVGCSSHAQLLLSAKVHTNSRAERGPHFASSLA